MKSTLKLWMLTALVMLGLASCTDTSDDPQSAVDTLPMPPEYAANKDKTVKPGDSFFDYCNGAWLAATPIPTDPAKNIGGLYDAIGPMNDRVEQLKTSVPDIGKYFSLMDKIHKQPDAERQYIATQKAKIQKPASKEEAYRTIGKMYMDGIAVMNMTYRLVWDKDKLKGYFQIADPGAFANMTRAAGKNSVPALLAEGMGVDPSMIIVGDAEMEFWNYLWEKYTVDDLYQKMQAAWLEYEAFADQQGLDAYNNTLPANYQLTETGLHTKERNEFSYILSYHFQQKFLTQGLKDKFLNITKEIQAALRHRIQKVDWMSETTKQQAIDKLDHYMLYVAFPDTWHTDCVATLADCETMAEALHRVKATNARLLVALTGTNDVFSHYLTQEAMDSDGQLVPMDLTLANAFYSPSYNCVLIYPAVLLPPIMPEEGMSEACSYAAFCIIGHEFTHGFDNSGSQWDKYGQKNNWWTVNDLMNFEDRKQNLIRTYSNMELDPQRAPLTFCDGERTQGENIADLGGFLATLDAYKAHLIMQGFTGETLNEQLRKFYESYAHVWCIQYGKKKWDVLVKTDVHSHARLRVNGVVMNTDLWYDLYNVDSNNLLYLPKERRTYIW